MGVHLPLREKLRMESPRRVSTGRKQLRRKLGEVVERDTCGGKRRRWRRGWFLFGGVHLQYSNISIYFCRNTDVARSLFSIISTPSRK